MAVYVNEVTALTLALDFLTPRRRFPYPTSRRSPWEAEMHPRCGLLRVDPLACISWGDLDELECRSSAVPFLRLWVVTVLLLTRRRGLRSWFSGGVGHFCLFLSVFWRPSSTSVITGKELAASALSLSEVGGRRLVGSCQVWCLASGPDRSRVV